MPQLPVTQLVDINAPIDDIQAASLEQIRAIRRYVDRAKDYVAMWQPRPMPADFEREDPRS
jgi:hypothetical protein